MPRTPPRRRSSKPTGRSAASGREPLSGPGCSGSSPTRPGTGVEPKAGGRSWPCASAASARALRPRFRPPQWWLAAAAVLLAVVLVLAASPPARDTIAGWLGLRGVVIQKVQNPPTPTPLPPGPLGQRLRLGERVTLDQARSKAGFTVLLPAGLGGPDEVYYDSGHGMVSLVYASRPGLPAPDATGVSLLVSELPARLTQDSFGKMLGAGSTLQEVDLGT